VFVPPRYSESEARAAIATSFSWSEALRKLGRCPTGGAPVVLKKWVDLWGISTEHFDPNAARRIASEARGRPMEELLVEHSTIKRGSLKRRLYREGLKHPVCEMCGVGESWNGMHISMILDHINGVRDDNRLENRRIVCPNCNAGLDTHCGKGARLPIVPQDCPGCGETFAPNRVRQKYCSAACAYEHMPRPQQRRTVRPPLEDLLEGVAAFGYEALGRRHGVSGTSIRKWIKDYGMIPPASRGGEVVPPPKPRLLSNEQAKAALEMLAEGMAVKAVANAFAVSRYVIRDLRDGKTYKELPRPLADDMAA
jgi:hypothetical protein